MFEKLLLWSAQIAWPIATLIIALIYRKPIYSLLSNISGIAGRAVTQPFEFSVGEKIKLVFQSALDESQPHDVKEALSLAKEAAYKAIDLYSLTKSEKKLLQEIASKGDKGYEFKRSGNALRDDYYDESTLIALLEKGLVIGTDKRYAVHPVVTKFFKAGS